MTADAAPIDPLAPARSGIYRDGVVEVRSAGRFRARLDHRSIRTGHFDVHPEGSTIRIEHSLDRDEVDDDLAGLLAAELFGPGWLRGADLFERIFTGIVLTSTDSSDPLAGWELFYRNTVRRLADPSHATAPERAHGSLAGYAPVHAHAETLLAPGSVLELGCCFGFFSLRLAAAGRETLATDVNPGTVGLLAAVAPRLGVDLRTLVADAAHVPLGPRSADTVVALHLLEHLAPDHGDRVVVEALRLARRRLVVAVPLEEEADETWGHVRTVSLADLERCGVLTGRPFDVHEHHGGWLVVDVGG